MFNALKIFFLFSLTMTIMDMIISTMALVTGCVEVGQSHVRSGQGGGGKKSCGLGGMEGVVKKRYFEGWGKKNGVGVNFFEKN